MLLGSETLRQFSLLTNPRGSTIIGARSAPRFNVAPDVGSDHAVGTAAGGCELETPAGELYRTEAMLAAAQSAPLESGFLTKSR